MNSLVSSFISDFKGLSQEEMPKLTVMYAELAMERESYEDNFVPIRMHRVFLIGKSRVMVDSGVAKQPRPVPPKEVVSLWVQKGEGSSRDLVQFDELVSDLKGLTGQELVDKLLVLKSLLINRAEVFKSHVVLSEVPTFDRKPIEQPKPRVEKDLSQVASSIVTMCSPEVLWNLHLCVLSDRVNPVSRFALPDLERKAMIKSCCFGNTTFGYKEYSDGGLFSRVAELLGFPKILSLRVPLRLGYFIKHPDVTDEMLEANNPLISCLADSEPEWVMLEDKEWKGMDTYVLARCSFSNGASLYGWKHLQARQSHTAAGLLQLWGVMSSMDTPL